MTQSLHETYSSFNCRQQSTRNCQLIGYFKIDILIGALINDKLHQRIALCHDDSWSIYLHSRNYLSNTWTRSV